MLKCSRCCKELSEEEFSVNPKSGAFYKVCDNCRNKSKEYYENNKEYYKGYRENNKDKRKEYQKEYYENNKDKIKERDKKYRENNKDKMKEYQKEYAQRGALYSTYKDKFHSNEDIR